MIKIGYALDKDINSVFDERQIKLFEKENERWILKIIMSNRRIAAFYSKNNKEKLKVGGVVFECMMLNRRKNLFDTAKKWLEKKL